MIAGSLDLVITVCPAWAKHHAGGFTCSLHMGCLQHRGIHGAQRRLFIVSVRQHLIPALSHCKLGLVMLPALISGSLNNIPCLNMGSVGSLARAFFFPDTLGIEWAVCVQPGLGAGSFLGL